jgi:hypothetical protein
VLDRLQTLFLLLNLGQSSLKFLSFLGNGTARIPLGEFDHPFRLIVIG